MKNRKTMAMATGALAAVLMLGGIGNAYGESVEDASAPLGFVGETVARAGGGLARVVADLTGLDVADVMDRRNDGESFADIAKSEGVSTDKVKDAAVEDFASTLDGRLSSADPLPERGHRGPDGAFAGAPLGSVLADLCDLDVEEIHAMRMDGQSLTQIAESEGVDIETVIDTVFEQATERLQADVDEGRIDEDRKTEILEDLRTRLEEMVTSTDPLPERGPDRPERMPSLDDGASTDS